MNYSLDIAFHFPHDRFALGWQYIAPDKKDPYNTITLFLLIATINFNFNYEKEN